MPTSSPSPTSSPRVAASQRANALPAPESSKSEVLAIIRAIRAAAVRVDATRIFSELAWIAQEIRAKVRLTFPDQDEFDILLDDVEKLAHRIYSPNTSTPGRPTSPSKPGEKHAPSSPRKQERIRLIAIEKQDHVIKLLWEMIDRPIFRRFMLDHCNIAPLKHMARRKCHVCQYQPDLINHMLGDQGLSIRAASDRFQAMTGRKHGRHSIHDHWTQHGRAEWQASTDLARAEPTTHADPGTLTGTTPTPDTAPLSGS